MALQISCLQLESNFVPNRALQFVLKSNLEQLFHLRIPDSRDFYSYQVSYQMWLHLLLGILQS